MAEASATRISLGEKLSEKEALSNLEERLGITSKDFREQVDKDVVSRLKDNIEYKLTEPNSPERQNMIRIETANTIESRLKASGQVESFEAVEKDGVLGWNIKFKDGATEFMRFE